MTDKQRERAKEIAKEILEHCEVNAPGECCYETIEQIFLSYGSEEYARGVRETVDRCAREASSYFLEGVGLKGATEVVHIYSENVSDKILKLLPQGTEGK